MKALFHSPYSFGNSGDLFLKNVRLYINNYRKWERYFNMETLENPISS